MLGISHVLISGTATALFLGTAEPSVLLTGAIAGLLPDIDTSLSPAGRMFPWITGFLESRQGHRGVSHSIFASSLVFVFGYIISFFLYWFFPYASALAIGYSFGWFADVFTQGGCEMFWPSRLLCVCPGNRNLRLRTGSNSEYVVLACLIAVAISLFSINSRGGLFTQFNRLIASPSGVIRLYNESGNSHKIFVNVDGVRSSDRAKVDAKFFIIQQTSSGFIVQDDKGKIYKVGSDPDSQILTERITADVGSFAVTILEAVALDDEYIGESLSKFIRSGSLSYVTGQLTIEDLESLPPPDPYEFRFIKQSGTGVTLEAAPLQNVLALLGNEFGKGSLSIKIITSGV
jgi:inner membrane protein